MSASSAIEWTDATWNPVTGCSKVSPGCAHCYAETFAERWRGIPGHPFEQGFDLRRWPDRLDLPLRWRKPRMVFVNSMSDLFHEDVPFEFVDRVFGVMALAGQHTFQVLTKRPERAREYLSRVVYVTDPRADVVGQAWLPPVWPLPNVWIGTSIENRRFVGRADVLRETPAAVRFISAEPLLGPLLMDAIEGTPRDLAHGVGKRCWYDGYAGPELDLRGIDWLIVGGESGPRHRRVDVDWVRALRDRAEDYGVAFFFKQWGGRTPKAGGRELDGRTWDEMPATGRTPAPRGAVPAGQAVAT